MLELLARPPGKFNSFASGWTNDDGRSNNGVGIHHPDGDVKKISTYDKKLSKGNWGTPIAKVWKVKEWKSGSTEGGSSGSPLYNSNGLIIGQLYGGKAACGNKKNDFYGRFDQSWDDQNGASNQLKPWLNPNGTGNAFIESMSGDEPCKVFYNFSNASDLHTSANVDAVPPFNGPLPGTRSYYGVYMASGNIQTGANVTIQNNTIVKFLGQEIILAAGFTAQQGSDFLARIQPCIRGCDADVGRYSSIAGDEKEFFTLSDGKTHTNDDKETQELSNNNNNIISYEVTFHLNPANEKLQIQIGNKEGLSKIMVYNAIGQLVYEEAINQKNELLLITENYKPGIYFVNILNTYNENVVTKKFVKE